MGCADIWQPDVARCGGVTEVQKIVHIAEANGITVVPHGGWVTNFHIVMSSMACPMAEYFPPYDAASDTRILLGEPVPSDGYVTLSNDPGFGWTVNDEAVRRFEWNA